MSIPIISANVNKFFLERRITSNSQELLAVKLNALVVDDDKFNRDIAQTFLQRLGIKIIEQAVNGQEAVATFKSRLPGFFDFIIMDLEMPIMNGKEAIKLIRKNELENRRIPTEIIIVSGNCDAKE